MIMLMRLCSPSNLQDVQKQDMRNFAHDVLLCVKCARHKNKISNLAHNVLLFVKLQDVQKIRYQNFAHDLLLCVKCTRRTKLNNQ